MSDNDLENAWALLEPDGERRRRMETRVRAWLEAADTSLLSEWLALFRMAPLPAFGLTSASALSLLAAPPLLWLVLVVF
jgi:hypothetical protein